MNAITGCYISVPLATLQTMLTQALQTRSDILVASQSSTRGGVTVNRAMLADVTSEIGEISFAIQQQTGGTVRTSYPDMSNGNSGGRRCC